MMGPSINKIIYMDKVGTKATAVTAIKMSPIMVGLHPIRIPHVVKLNRPFIYMIIDRVNRLPIFCGVLRDPGDHQLL